MYICSPYGNSKADFNFALDNENFRPGKYYYNEVKYLQERISGADFPDTYEEYPEDMISPEEYDEIISFCKTGIEWSEYDAEDYESAKEEDIRHLNPGDRLVQGKKYAVEVVVEPTIYRELVPCLKNAAKNN